ncbi:MAG: glycosyltransferase [Bacteroidales bacterium]|jgi:glycosyltransferase involved in cell wall biosynthesis|nr:glycosyltransferase [Bacteroidales bacterium]
MQEKELKKEKKDIAFIIGKMNQGGPSRVFLNICSLLDRNKYSITLIQIQKGGQLQNEIPADVRIKYAKPESLFNNEKDKNRLNIIFWRAIKLLIRILSKIIKTITGEKDEVNWALTELFIKKDTESYDLTMSLIEGTSNYYLAKFVNARIKIGRIPTDYRVLTDRAGFDKKYFKLLDYIVTNSLINHNYLCEVFPDIKNRFLYVDTIVIPEQLHKLADQHDGFQDDYKGKRLTTLARLDDTKGVDLIIESVNILRNKGKSNFRWFIFGRGDKTKYLKMIDEYKIDKFICFMDPVHNPYPFLKQSDIYVQPSRYEGKSNAVKEAKALFKPVIITSFNTANEHVTHMKDGIISKEISANALAESILLLFENPEIGKAIAEYLQMNFKGNSYEFDKILALIK